MIKLKPIGMHRRWWNSFSLGQAISDNEGWYIPAPENKPRWSDVMERLRDRRDLKKMRKKRERRNGGDE